MLYWKGLADQQARAGIGLASSQNAYAPPKQHISDDPDYGKYPSQLPTEEQLAAMKKEIMAMPIIDNPTKAEQYMLHREFVQELMDYLQARPYIEVGRFMVEMERLKAAIK